MAGLTNNSYVTFVVTLLLAPGMLYMVIRSMIQICKQENKKRLVPTCTIIALLSFTCFIVFACIFQLYRIIIQGSTSFVDTIITSCWGFYGLGLWVMLFIYIIRIDFLFENNSKLLYPRLIQNILFIWILLIFLMFVLIVIALVALGSPTSLILTSITLVLYIGFTVYISYLFIKKIFIVMHMRYETLNESNDPENGTDKIVVELNTVKSIIKYCMLVLMGICSSYITNIIVVIDLASGVTGVPEYAFIAVDILVNSMSLYFMFVFNNDEYNKLCKCCNDRFQKFMVKRLYNRHETELKVALETYQNAILTQPL